MPVPQKRTVVEVTNSAKSTGADPYWLVRVDVEGAMPWIYAFPHETLIYRSAEYGVDPSDADTLLDIVIHEHHFELSADDPTFLYNTDEKTAREAHLARVAEAKTRVSHVDPDNLLDTIRGKHDPADPRFAKYRDKVRTVRARNLRARNVNG